MVKKISYCVYAHKSNIHEFLNCVSIEEVSHITSILDWVTSNSSISFDILKYNKHTKSLSLISCPTFDIKHEPIVESSYCFKDCGVYKVIVGGTTVYHHKWQFVSSDYTGFDLKASKKRSLTWESIPDIKKHKSRIGNKNYWYALLRENNISI